MDFTVSVYFDFQTEFNQLRGLLTVSLGVMVNFTVLLIINNAMSRAK